MMLAVNLVPVEMPKFLFLCVVNVKEGVLLLLIMNA